MGMCAPYGRQKADIMPFKFRMQKVLDYREQLEEEAKVRLGKAESDLRASQEKLDNLRQQLAEAQNRLFSGELMQNSERWLHEQYVKGLRGDVNEEAMRMRMFRQIAEEARKLLAARAIDRKLLDKLKEKQKKQFIHAENKQEQNFNDEIATIRYKAAAV